MEIAFSAKSLTIISTIALTSPSKSSCHFYKFPTTSPRTELLARNGVRFCSPSVTWRRRCGKLGIPARFLVRASLSGRSILVAIAVAVANFAALRLFYLNHTRLRKESRKHAVPEEPELLENANFPKDHANENDIESPRDLSLKSFVEERNCVSEKTDNTVCIEKGHGPAEDYLLKSQMTALKHDETRGDEISEVHDSEVSVIHSSNIGSLQTKERSGPDLPAVMLGNVSLLEQETSASDKPNPLLGGPHEAGIMAKPSLRISAGPMNGLDAKSNRNGELSHVMSGESEFQVLDYSRLDAIFQQEVHTFYKEKKAGLNSLLPSRVTSVMSSHMSLNNSGNHSLHLTPKRRMKVDAEFSHSKGVSQEEVPVASKGSSSKQKESAKVKGILRSGRTVNQNYHRDLSRFHQTNGVHVKDKSNPPEKYLITYNCLLREERLADCVELLENMERKGVLDMDKIYHARFFKICKSKKAVKEAFRFIKLIKKPTLSTFNMLLSVCASSQDSEGPFEVLLLVKRLGLKVDCKLYTTLISACAKTGKVDAMFEVFHEMVNAGVEPNVHTYGALIDGCARAGQVAKAFGAYGIMSSKKVKPDRVIFNALITACGQSGVVDRAFDVLAEMRAEPHPIDPDHVTVGALMKTCAQAGQIARAREVYKIINQYNIKGTPEVYTIAVNSCSQEGDLEFALCVYNDMKRHGVIPDEMFISALIDVAGHAGKVDTAFEILQGAKIQGIQLGNVAYSSLMGACSNGKNWQKALELYDEIKFLGMTPTVSTMNALITSLCDGDKLKKAVEVLDEMKEAEVYPNDITYSILLVVCERKDEPELAFKLFAKAKENDLPPNLIMCRCLTGLCLRRFEKESSLGEPVLSFHSGTPQIDNKWAYWALKVYRETIAAGIIPSVEVVSLVLGCLQLPCDASLRNRMIENMGIKSDVSRCSNLYSLLDGFGEYDPRSFSLLEEAASLGVVPCVSYRKSLIIVDARKLEIHTAKVYLLTVLKGLRHRLAAGAKLPSVTILLQAEKTQIISSKGDKIVNLAGRVGQEVGAVLRRLGLPYQGKESLGKIRISGLALKRWFQPKLIKLVSPFEGRPTESSSLQSTLAKGITNQQRSIRSNDLSLERNPAPYKPPKAREEC